MIYNPNDLLPLINAIHVLLAHDEIERALWLCDNVPAYWRDNPTPELTKLKNDIYLKSVTPYWYSTQDQLPALTKEASIGFIQHIMRGALAKALVDHLNKDGITPHIVDMGPGEYLLPYGLHLTGSKFTYEGLSLTKHEMDELPEEFGYLMIDNPDLTSVIFLANEIIEHLPDPCDIKRDQMRFAPTAKYIQVSTPRYAFDPVSDWSKKELFHLRAYTPKEFQQTVIEMFPDFNWGYQDGQIMSMVGEIK